MTVRLQVTGYDLVRGLGTLVTGCGVLAAAALAWFLIDGSAYQYQQNLRFERQLAGGEARAPVVAAAAAESPESKDPAGKNSTINEVTHRQIDPLILGRLEIPSLNLQVLVREGVDDTSLRKAVGHLPESASAGSTGNFILLGHRDTFFHPLRDIAVHDLIRIRTFDRVFEYEVDLVAITAPDDVLTLTPAEGANATLITCFPFSYTGPAPRRFVVRARLKGNLSQS